MALPPLLIPILLVLAGAGGSLLSLGAMGRLLRRKKRLEKLAPVGEARGLSEAVDRPAAVRGVLLGGAIETGFGGAAQAIEEAHVKAVTLASIDEPRIRVGEVVVWVEGPLQVVTGTSERTRRLGDDALSARRLEEGDEVIAEGMLRRAPGAEVSEGTYRDLSFHYKLSPETDPAWPGRPVSLHAARPPSPLPPLAALLVSLAGLRAGIDGLALPPQALAPAAPAPSGAARARPACAAEVAALLDRNDPWAAAERASGCDALSQAEAAWMLGEVGLAAATFRQAREADPSMAPTLTEVEATILVDPRRGAGLVSRLKADWYRGPQDPSQSQLDCIVEVLEGRRTWSPYCLADARKYNFYGQSRRDIHHQPAYALHEPDLYPRFQPLGLDDNTHLVGCGSGHDSLERLTDLQCRAGLGASRALFAAVTGDRAAMDRELSLVDQAQGELLRLEATLPRSWSPDERSARVEMLNEFSSRRFEVEKTIAVAAAAAWVARDEARLARYVPRAEAHARALLEEHTALAEGKRRSPDPAYSPSDYSVVDMAVWEAADREAPEAWVERLKGLRYDSPARLRALVSPRPQHKAALAAWVRGGFTPACRTCGVYALLGATFRRREAASLVGDQPLAERLGQITQKLGTSLLHSPGFGPVLSLESLVAR